MSSHPNSYPSHSIPSHSPQLTHRTTSQPHAIAKPNETVTLYYSFKPSRKLLDGSSSARLMLAVFYSYADDVDRVDRERAVEDEEVVSRGGEERGEPC